jgi:hypothetical protein
VHPAPLQVASIICLVVELNGIAPRMLPMIGVNALKVDLTETTTTQPIAGLAEHAPTVFPSG